MQNEKNREKQIEKLWKILKKLWKIWEKFDSTCTVLNAETDDVYRFYLIAKRAAWQLSTCQNHHKI